MDRPGVGRLERRLVLARRAEPARAEAVRDEVGVRVPTLWPGLRTEGGRGVRGMDRSTWWRGNYLWLYRLFIWGV